MPWELEELTELEELAELGDKAELEEPGAPFEEIWAELGSLSPWRTTIMLNGCSALTPLV